LRGDCSDNRYWGEVRDVIRSEIQPILEAFNAMLNMHRNPEEVFQMSALYAVSAILRNKSVVLEDEETFELINDVKIVALYDEMKHILNFKYGARNPAHEGRSITTENYGSWSSRELKKFLEDCGIGFVKVNVVKTNGNDTKIDLLRIADGARLMAVLKDKRVI